MPTTRSLTRGGITWGFTHDVTYGQYANGDYWVLGNVNGGVELSSISPQCTLGAAFNTGGPAVIANTFADTNGSMVNPHWVELAQTYSANIGSIPFGATEFKKVQGYAGINSAGSYFNEGYVRAFNWALQNNQPISNSNRKTLPVNSSLVSSDTSNNTSLPSIKKIAILTCVSAVPPDGAFRPAYNTTDKTHYFTSGDIDYSILANIPASSVSALMPSSTYFSALLLSTSGPRMCYQAGEYEAYRFVAYDSNCGQYYAGEGGNMHPVVAIGYLNTDRISAANKITLANQIIQIGIDAAGNISRCIGKPYGFSKFKGGGGGHHGNLECPFDFLTAIVRPGTTAKTYAKTLASLVTTNRIFLSNNQFYKVQPHHVTFSAKLMQGFSQYNSLSASLCLQTSDIGTYQFNFGGEYPDNAQSSDGFTPGNGCIKLHSPEEMNAVGVPTIGGNLGRFNANNYRLCCTSFLNAPFIFGMKAMGAENNMSNPDICQYFENYRRRQGWGPYPHQGAGQWLTKSVTLRYFGNSPTPVDLGSISNQGFYTLYDTWVKHSFGGARNAGTYAACQPVSGVESIGIPTDPNIYIEVSAPLRPGINQVYCRGVSGYAWPDLLVFIYADDSALVDNPIKIFDVNLYMSNIVGQVYSTAVSNGTAVFDVPVSPVAIGGKNIIQVVSARAVNGQLEIKTTNALKVEIIP